MGRKQLQWALTCFSIFELKLLFPSCCLHMCVHVSACAYAYVGCLENEVEEEQQDELDKHLHIFSLQFSHSVWCVCVLVFGRHVQIKKCSVLKDSANSAHILYFL